MEWHRVVVVGYFEASKIFFGTVLREGFSVVFRQSDVKLGEVYDVTVRKNSARSDAKAQFDVLDCKRVESEEFSSIRVDNDKHVRITVDANFIENDTKHSSIRIFFNEVYGKIIDLDGRVPKHVLKPVIEFRLTSSPRDKFCTICVVTKFIEVTQRKSVQPTNKGVKRIGFVWKVRERDILLWSSGCTRNVSAAANKDLLCKWVEFTLISERGDLLTATIDRTIEAVCPTRIKCEVAEIQCELVFTGQTTADGDSIWKSSIVGPVISLDSEFPHSIPAGGTVKCWLAHHNSDLYKFKVSKYPDVFKTDVLIREKSSSMFASDNHRPRYSRELYMLDMDDDESVVENNCGEDTKTDSQQDVSVSYDTDEYHTAIEFSDDDRIPYTVTSKVEKSYGVVLEFTPSGGAYVWCMNLRRDFILPSQNRGSQRPGNWISFDVDMSTNREPFLIASTVVKTKDRVLTRMASGKPELKCSLSYDEEASSHFNQCVLNSDLVGDVLCESSYLSELLGPGSSITTWIVRIKHNGRVWWKVSKFHPPEDCNENEEDVLESSYRQNTPAESIDSESADDGRASPLLFLTDSQLSALSSADTFDYTFTKYPALLDLLAVVDNDAYQHVKYLLENV